MSEDGDAGPAARRSDPGWTRRDFVKTGFGLLIGSTVVAGCGGDGPSYAAQEPPAARPDILVILTDQERRHVHWPPGLLERLMPSWGRLRENGLTFHRAYASASQCSPSRACLLTGEYGNVNGVPTLPDAGMPGVFTLPNLASVLRSAGYDVIWKGKWHLSFPLGFPGGSPSGEVWEPADIAALESRYAMAGWNPPDAGNNAGIFGSGGVPSMGGGTPNNDGRFLAGATGSGQTPGVEGGVSTVEFLRGVSVAPPGERPPFALFVSLVNPHDITFFPTGWDLGGYRLDDFADLGVALPPNFPDDLASKPSVQRAYRDAVDAREPLHDDPALGPTREQYVNFYAYLHAVVEPHIQALLALVDSLGLRESLLIFRTADHGEAGLSHGLREKSYSAYEEMTHVPLVVSNPRLFPAPRETEALWTHVDLLPTIADLAGAAAVGVGKSMVPVLLDPDASVQDGVLFAFDDTFVLPPTEPGSRIRSLLHDRWTYSVYFGPQGESFEYELYDNRADPLQMHNLLAAPGPDVLATWSDLHQRLLDKMRETDAAPRGFTFPAVP